MKPTFKEWKEKAGTSDLEAAEAAEASPVGRYQKVADYFFPLTVWPSEEFRQLSPQKRACLITIHGLSLLGVMCGVGFGIWLIWPFVALFFLFIWEFIKARLNGEFF